MRLGFRRLIDAHPALSVVVEADSAEVALEAVAKTDIDLAIVDLSLKDGSGLELIRTLREAAADVSILVLSIHE